jgi:hypothetical protein
MILCCLNFTVIFSFKSTTCDCNCVCRPHERTLDDLEIIYEELLHIKALSHLSHSVKRELAAVIMFEAHPHAGTVCKFSSCYTFNSACGRTGLTDIKKREYG